MSASNMPYHDDPEKWTKLCEFLGHWLADKIALKEGGRSHYVQFITEAAMQIDSEETLVDMAYNELDHHISWQRNAMPTKEEIMEVISKFKRSLDIPACNE